MSADPTAFDTDASLAAGTQLGRYTIVSKIGSGGMGVVYKAYDTQLDRHVALKVLRPELLHDSEKVRRFTQEAKAASALNHPAIVGIYEVATTPGGIQYIAMEYVEGPSLRQYLHENVPLTKLLVIIAEAAEGMAKAHSMGVVHRDLKPDNIVLTPDGQPKIVDFGLAKLLQADLLGPADEEAAPTLSLPHSKTGAVLGTVGYMSPEQVEGRAVDHRSDVFSLGCILYEAVAGRSAFNGTSVVETLHQILTAEPVPILDANRDAPAEIDRIVRRCLAKDPDRRYQSIREIAIEIRQILDGENVAARPKRKRRWLAAVLLMIAALVLVTIVAMTGNRPTDLTNYRFTPFATEAAYEGFPAWSPDGKSIAYIGDVDGILQVFVKGLDASQATQLTHAVSDCREPFWDPRGDRIFYISLAEDRDSLWSVGVGGGEPEVVVKNVHTAAIAPNRRTLALLRETSDQGNYALSLWTASPPEAEPKRFSAPPLPVHFATGFIRFSPDNKKIGLWAESWQGYDDEQKRSFWIIPRDGAAPYVVLRTLPAPRPFPFSWMPDNRRVVFGADYLSPSPGAHLWTADIESGVIQPLTRTSGNESYASVSPDGKRIVFSTEEIAYHLLRVPIDGSAPTPFLATGRTEKDPAWSPNKDEYAYVTNRTGTEQIWLASGDGQWRRPVTSEKDFVSGRTFLLGGLAFSPDGQRIAYQRRDNKGFQVWISSTSGGPAIRIEESRYSDAPTWSPDGNWIVYVLADAEGLKYRLAKLKLGRQSQRVVIKQTIVYGSNPQWSPRGDWITVDLPEGFSVVSPDGEQTRVLSERSWLVHTWARDGASIYGIRTDESLHLVMARIDLATGQETVIRDLGQSPPTIDPVEGLSLAPDGKSFLTSMARLKGDLWILDGFPEPKRTVFGRLRSIF